MAVSRTKKSQSKIWNSSNILNEISVKAGILKEILWLRHHVLNFDSTAGK